MQKLKPWILVLCLSIVLGLGATQTRVSAAPNPQDYRVGAGSYPTGEGNRLVWIASDNPIQSDAYTADVVSRTLVGLEIDPTIQTTHIATNGQLVVWIERPSQSSAPEYVIRGKDMVNGRTLTIATTLDPITTLFVRGSGVFWVQTQDGGTSTIMMRDSATMSPATMVRTLLSHPVRVVMADTVLAWIE